MKTHVRQAKEAPPHGLGHQLCSPVSPRAVVTPRASPRESLRSEAAFSARPRIMLTPSPWAADVNSLLEEQEQRKRDRIAEKARLAKEAAEAEALAKQAAIEEAKKKTRTWGELPPGVIPDDVRKAQRSIKEKLIDKFSNLTNAFRAFDKDGSGTVSRTEFYNYLEVINLNAERKEVMDALFERIDADESDSFDFKEFLRVMNSADVFKMENVKEKIDGYKLKQDNAEMAERKALEMKAKQAGMTVEEYVDYFNDLPMGAFAQMKSEDMVQVARDRWGKKIKGDAQAFAV